MKPIVIEVPHLYETIRNIYTGRDIPPILPHRQNDKKDYDPYKRRFEILLENVPDIPGVYLWFAKYYQKPIEYIYVGESGTKNTGLIRRFKEEFKNWHHCFSATAFNSNEYLSQALTIYVESGKISTRKRYRNSICNDWLKRGATHLAYYSDIPRDIVKQIQDDLIQLFSNPRGNVKDIRDRPLPLEELHPLSITLHEKLVECCKNVTHYTPKL
jgi:hypothetical protein